MLNKKGVINMKKNTKNINQVALLRAAQESLNGIQNLNSYEWVEMIQILCDGLDTNILWLNWNVREELILQLEAGKMTRTGQNPRLSPAKPGKFVSKRESFRV